MFNHSIINWLVSEMVKITNLIWSNGGGTWRWQWTHSAGSGAGIHMSWYNNQMQQRQISTSKNVAQPIRLLPTQPLPTAKLESSLPAAHVQYGAATCSNAMVLRCFEKAWPWEAHLDCVCVISCLLCSIHSSNPKADSHCCNGSWAGIAIHAMHNCASNSHAS